MSKTLKIKNKNTFVKNFLQPLTKISDACVLELDKNILSCLTCTSDNSVIFHIDFPIDGEFEDGLKLNCPDLKKLIKAIDAISYDEIAFNILENSLSYNDSNIRFKYHLLEDDIIKRPKLSLKKLSDTHFNSSFILNTDRVKDLVRGSIFSSDSNKIYIYSDENGVHGELTDKVRNNIDTITIKICDSFDGDRIENIPLNFEIFRIMELSSSKDVFVKINNKLGIVIFEIENNYNKMKYVLSSLIK
jgi:hypothetical protein